MVFKWLYRRVASSFVTSTLELLEDKEFVKEVVNPIIDAVIDRQISRLEGRLGKLTQTAIPKISIKDALGLFAMKLLGGIGSNNPQQINSSPDSELLELNK